MKRLLLFMLVLGLSLPGAAQEPDPRVKKVHAIFKTHLDIGFTELSSKVEQRYIDEFIPKAIAVAEQLRREGADERYVWTTGSWLINAYLRQTAPSITRPRNLSEPGCVSVLSTTCGARTSRCGRKEASASRLCKSLVKCTNVHG